jgi:hypothetical protein
MTERWLDQPEPQDMGALNWSLRKYLRFIQAAGGWQAFQKVLKALAVVAQRHSVSIAAVATRYVLNLPPVSAVIVGSRLSVESDKYTERNLSAFSFTLTEDDNGLIAKAQEALTDVPGDCGGEYRRAPFLTATGDLSDHLAESKDVELRNAIAAGTRIEYSSGSKWEPIAVRLANNLPWYQIKQTHQLICNRAIAEPSAPAIPFESQEQQPTVPFHLAFQFWVAAQPVARRSRPWTSSRVQ